MGGPRRPARRRRLNAVPPLGIEGIEVTDDGVERDGVTVFGALGVGGLKMKIHKACIARLFERNDLVLDAETIADVARELSAGLTSRRYALPVWRMPRVIGIDPGTVSIDVCGLDDGAVFLDRSLPTAEALADPSRARRHCSTMRIAAPLDLVAGPSGYGLPLTRARDLTDDDLRLAYLAPSGEPGGIGGLRSLMRALARSVAAGRAHAGRRASRRRCRRTGR